MAETTIEQTIISSPFDITPNFQEEDKIKDEKPKVEETKVEEPKVEEVEDTKETKIESTVIEKEVEESTPPAGEPSSDFHVIGNYWKEKGYIAEDVEIKENITPEELEELYRTSMEDRLLEQNLTRLQEDLNLKGYTLRDLETARLINSGVKPEDVIDVSNYKTLAEYELPEDEDLREQDSKFLLNKFYTDKGFSEAKVSSLVANAFRDGTVELDLEEARIYFSEMADKKEAENIRIAKETQAKQQSQQKKMIDRINSYLNKGIIDGVKYSPEEMEEVRKAMFEKTEVIETDKGSFRGTKYDKLRYEINKDDDKMMAWAVQMILGVNRNKIEEEVTRKTKSSILEGLGRGLSNPGKRDETIGGDGIERTPLFK